MKTTTIPPLASLIKDAGFDWSNSDITDALFPQPKEVSSEYKLFHFDKWISSEDVIAGIAMAGYRPANAWELVSFAKDGWNSKDWVVSLGSVGGVRGIRSVPCLDEGGSGRRLSLAWFDGGWSSDCRFLGVRNLSSDAGNLESGPSDALTLDAAVKIVKEAGYVIYKQI